MDNRESSFNMDWISKRNRLLTTCNPMLNMQISESLSIESGAHIGIPKCTDPGISPNLTTLYYV